MTGNEITDNIVMRNRKYIIPPVNLVFTLLQAYFSNK